MGLCNKAGYGFVESPKGSRFKRPNVKFHINCTSQNKEESLLLIFFYSEHEQGARLVLSFGKSFYFLFPGVRKEQEKDFYKNEF